MSLSLFLVLGAVSGNIRSSQKIVAPTGNFDILWLSALTPRTRTVLLKTSSARRFTPLGLGKRLKFQTPFGASQL